jgi:hypothetical protein
MFRVGRAQDRAARSRKGASPLRLNGRSFEGFVWVDPQACDARSLKRWIALAQRYVDTLPAKKKGGDR